MSDTPETYIQMAQSTFEETLRRIVSEKSYQRVDFEKHKTERAVAIASALQAALMGKEERLVGNLYNQLALVMDSQWEPKGLL